MNFISLLFMVAIAVKPPPEASPRPVVIRGCSVLDVAAGVMLADRTVVLDGGKIRAVAAPGAPVEDDVPNSVES